MKYIKTFEGLYLTKQFEVDDIVFVNPNGSALTPGSSKLLKGRVYDIVEKGRKMIEYWVELEDGRKEPFQDYQLKKA
jgi:hypothetical protein